MWRQKWEASPHYSVRPSEALRKLRLLLFNWLIDTLIKEFRNSLRRNSRTISLEFGSLKNSKKSCSSQWLLGREQWRGGGEKAGFHVSEATLWRCISVSEGRRRKLHFSRLGLRSMYNLYVVPKRSAAKFYLEDKYIISLGKWLFLPSP